MCWFLLATVCKHCEEINLPSEKTFTFTYWTINAIMPTYAVRLEGTIMPEIMPA